MVFKLFRILCLKDFINNKIFQIVLMSDTIAWDDFSTKQTFIYLLSQLTQLFKGDTFM